MAKGELAEGRKQIACVVDEEFAKRLDLFAERWKISRSQAMFMCMGYGMEMYEGLETLGLSASVMRGLLKLEESALDMWKNVFKSGKRAKLADTGE